MNNKNTAQWLGELIAFPTISSDTNMDLIGHVQTYLDDLGVPWELFENEEGNKANLLARIGPQPTGSAPNGVILSGHSDVVPVAGQNWSSDPFVMEEKDGKYYGRGTCDMKGFIASALAHIPKMQAANLREPIYIAISYDEETGCTGVRDMVAHIGAMKVRPRSCIVGEPTSMGVINAHKGIRSYRVDIAGQAAHSSLPHLGCNAIVYAAQLIEKVCQLGERAKSVADDRFIPPHTTFNIGTIKGGVATNIIAQDASFIFEFRAIPTFDGDGLVAEFTDYAVNTVLPKMRETAPEATITITQETNAPPLLAQSGSDAESFVMQLVRTNEVGAVSYATEAGLFQTTGSVPTVVCGPGSIDQAHKPDEFIEISQLEECDQLMERLIEALS